MLWKLKTNLNCGNCVAAVTPHLNSEPNIRHWSVATDDPRKILTVEGDQISLQRIEQLVAASGFRVLEVLERPADGSSGASPLTETTAATESLVNLTPAASSSERSFVATYYPLLLIVGYLLGIVGVMEWRAGEFHAERAMSNFMSGFFLAFSFFKLLDLRGFATSYQTYDLLARAVPGYGLVYPFLELALGGAYLSGWQPFWTNAFTLALMLLGLAGVTQALLEKRKIQCACLGTVFNLPMSKVTFVEDALMAAMALFMLLNLPGH